jgi:hypothetical protein
MCLMEKRQAALRCKQIAVKPCHLYMPVESTPSCAFS